MKTNIIKKTNSGFTFIDFLTTVFFAVLIYGSYLYIPLVYKADQLQTITKDYTFRTNGAGAEKLQKAVIEDAKRKLNIELNPDDVTVSMDEDRTMIQATWRPVIQLPFGYQIPRVFTVKYERKELK